MKLSAIVITYNKENTIKQCLDSLQFADEIIIVDSGSTDKTLEYASQTKARIFKNPWPGYGAQKNYASRLAQGEWVLFIDADEVVTPELQTSIQKSITSSDTVDFYWLRIITVFLGKALRHVYGHNPRLFRRLKGQWTTDLVHEQVETTHKQRLRLGDTHSRVIISPLLHYSHDTIAAYLKSMNQYTTLDAEQMKKSGHHRSGKKVRPSWWLPWKLASRQTIKLLFYRRGILDGWAGIVWSILSGYYEFVMARKYLKLCA